jgi:hypothetical protein
LKKGSAAAMANLEPASMHRAAHEFPAKSGGAGSSKAANEPSKDFFNRLPHFRPHDVSEHMNYPEPITTAPAPSVAPTCCGVERSPSYPENSNLG